MAGHYEQRKTVSLNPDTGKRTVKVTWVWVEDPKPAGGNKPKPKPKQNPTPKPKPAGNYPGDEAREAALSAAQKAAAIARKKAAQKALWESLKERSIQVRSKLAPKSPGARPPVSDPTKMTPQQKAEYDRWKGYSDWLKKKAKDEADLKRATAPNKTGHPLKGKTPTEVWQGKTLERLVREAKERQAKSGGYDLDAEYVHKLNDAYISYVQESSITLQDQIKRLKPVKTVKKDGKLYAAPGFDDEVKYNNKILESPEYKRALREYRRLYGKDGEGNAAVTGRDLEAIADAQRKHVFKLARDAMLHQVATLRKGDNTDRAEAARMLQQWDTGGKYLFEEAINQIDPSTTGWKYSYDFKTGMSKPVRRTVEEEFQARRQLFINEMSRRMKEEQNRQTLLRAGRAEWIKRYGHEFRPTSEDAQHASDMKLLADAWGGVSQKATYGAPDEGPKSREDINRTVDAAVAAWEAKYKSKYLSPHTLYLMEHGGLTGVAGENPADYQNYVRQLDLVRQRFFSRFGTESPGIAEAVLTAPGVRQSLAALGLGVGAIGGTLRVALAASTGNSQITLTETNTLPAKVQADFLNWMARNQSSYAGYAAGGAPTPEENPVDVWLRTPAGKDWQYKMGEKRRAGDLAFAGTWGGGLLGNDKASLLDKVEALNIYGTQPTSNDFFNFAFSLAADPTNALPLKATTWLPRLRAAITATEGVHGLKGLERAATGVHKWLTITEPELRAIKAWEPYVKALSEPGLSAAARKARAATINELVLARLAKIAEDGDTSLKKIQKEMRDLGFDKRIVNDHQIISNVQQALLERVTKAGIDYEDIAKKADEIYKTAKAKKEAEKIARSELIRKADAASAEAERIARESHEAARGRLLQERAGVKQRLTTNIQRAGTFVSTHTRAAPQNAPAHNPLNQTAPDPVHPSSSTSGPSDPVQQEMRAADPERNIPPQYPSESSVIRDNRVNVLPDSDAPIDVSAKTAKNTNYSPYGVDFPAGRETEDFLKSREFADIQEGMEAVIESGRNKGRPDMAVRRDMHDALYEMARRIHSSLLAKQEGLGQGVKLTEDGRIPWQARKDGRAFQVVGGRTSGKQYIATARDLIRRAGGGKTTSEARVVQSERHQFEQVARRLLELNSKLKQWEATGGKKGLSPEQYMEHIRDEILTFGLERRSASLAADLDAGIGTSMHGMLEHMIAEFDEVMETGVHADDIVDGAYDGMIPLGRVMVEDFLSGKDLAHYYETFSMLPGLRSGPGYETDLMEKTLNQGWRQTLTRTQFTKLLSGTRFSYKAAEVVATNGRIGTRRLSGPSPMRFRQQGAHLFSLFHLTLLDGDMVHLEDLSRSIETLLEREPDNIYGRMWKVMETHAGVPWADTFIDSEIAFQRAAIAGGRLHPNLAMAMIPYGPIARHLPVGHGYLPRLFGLAEAVGAFFKTAPPNWTDEFWTNALTKVWRSNPRVHSRRLLIREKPWTVAQQMAKASQLIDYIAKRYGDISRRSAFKLQVDDFAIDTIDRESYGYLMMRKEYIDARLAGRRLESQFSVEELGPEIAALRDEVTDAARYGSEFDNFWTRRLAKGLKRRQFDEIRDLFDDMYWKGQVTHDNPGLHTTQFYMKMQTLGHMQHGDTWVRTADSYFNHMKTAGYEEEARTVLREVLSPEIRRANTSAAESIYGLKSSVDGDLGGRTSGAVNEFLIRARLLKDKEEIMAELRQRKTFKMDQQILEEDIARAARIDEDEGARSLRRELEDPNQASPNLYDNADYSHRVQEAQDILDYHAQIQQDIENLKKTQVVRRKPPKQIGTAISPVTKLGTPGMVITTARPSPEAISAVWHVFYEARKKARLLGYDETSAAYIGKKAVYGLDPAEAKRLGVKASHGFPSELTDWWAVEVKTKFLVRRINSLMHGTVKALDGLEYISDAVDQQLREMVTIIKTIPGGDAAVESYARKFGNELYASRLIEYFKNEKWYKAEAAKVSEDALHASRLSSIQEQISKIRETLRKGEALDEKPHPLTDAERASKNREFASLQRQLKAVPQRMETLRKRLVRINDLLEQFDLPASERQALLERRGTIRHQMNTMESRIKSRLERLRREAKTGLVEGTGAPRPMTPEEIAAKEARIASLEADMAAVKKEIEDKIAARKPGSRREGPHPLPEGDTTPRPADLEGPIVREEPAAAATETPESATYETNDQGDGTPLTYADFPLPPNPADLNTARVAAAQRALDIFSGQSEEEWLRGQLDRAWRAHSRAKDKTAKEAAWKRIEDIHKAFKVIEMSKAGGKGSYVPPKARSTFATRIVSVAGDRAKGVLNPKYISAYVTGLDGAKVEQGRYLYKLWKRSTVDPLLGAVRIPGAVSRTYKKFGADIEKAFDTPIHRAYLIRAGFPPDILGDLTVTQLLVNLGEFEKSMANPEFKDLVSKVIGKVQADLKTMTKDDTYSFQRWLDDRLVRRGEYYDALLYEKHDAIVQEAIEKARNGEVRHGQLNLRGGERGPAGENPLTEYVEQDVRAVVGKARALAELGVDPHAYNEARKVLGTAMLQKNRARALVEHATTYAYKKTWALGLTTDSKEWDAVFREFYDEDFIKERAKRAEAESLKLLGRLAYDEMFGSSADDIIKEFESRYALDDVARGFEPGPISSFQQRTLEEAVKTHLGVTDLNDSLQMQRGLQAHGQHPPFHDRGAMREWLTKYGFWSPRTADAVESGKKSWSIQEEGQYYLDTYGQIPDWANADLLREGGPLNHLIHDEREYGAQNRKWGLFNRNMQARFETAKMTREERARFLVEGSEALGIKAKRDWPTEVRYVKERYGDLVMDEQGNLTAFPWLMNKKELRTYMLARSGKVAEDLIQNADELDVVAQMIELHMGRYFDEAAFKGKTMTYADFFTITSNITHDILLDPIWTKRGRDSIGTFIKGQAAFRRALVFTQIGFLMNNVIDTQIKGPWTHFITRSFHNGEVSERAMSYTLEHFGLDRSGQLLHDVPVHGTERWGALKDRPPRMYKDQHGVVRMETNEQKAMADLLERALAITELPAQGAQKAENFTKLRLAQGMYDGAYERAFKAIGDETLADAAAREFVGKEVNRLWPTVGDGPIERFFNTLSPFLSYQFKNHVLFIGELAGHPALYNYFREFGDLVESQNRERWERENPGKPIPPQFARYLELPWSPGDFVDLGVFSDAQRGLQPFYDIASGKAVSVKDFAAQWVRLVSANDQNIFLGIINAFHLSPHYEWKQKVGADGFPTGIWEKVEVPWEAPWGGAANPFNSFWPVDLVAKFIDANEGGLTVKEATRLLYQTAFFGGLKHQDEGAALNSFYYALRDKNPDVAKDWLDGTPEGASLKSWWLDKTHEYFTPQGIKDVLDPPTPDPNPWFHAQDKEFQDKVKQGFTDLTRIHEKWDAVIGRLEPGSEAMSQARLQAASEHYQYYYEHPWMFDWQVMKQTPAQWSAQLDTWRTQDLVQSYYNNTAPKSADYKTAVLWQKALTEWKASRRAFLDAYPQVEEYLGRTREGVEGVWQQTEQHWFDVLDKIGVRSVAIEAAKQAKDFDLLDQLYLANDLDSEALEKETLVNYYDDRDYVKSPGPFGSVVKTLRKDAGGQNLLPHVAVLPDFQKWRYDRMNPQQKKKFETDQKYFTALKAVIDGAKKSDNFGRYFVNHIKKDPWLRAQYFDRNPGKEEAWARNDDYIKAISKYGQLARAGKFAEAGRYFDDLPHWVKAQYYENNPEKRGNIQKNLQYMSYMERWVAHYKKKDFEGGADFFDHMPQWVKDRYYAKHPHGFGRGGGGGSAYSTAMGKWVKLLQANKDDEAKAYFDSLPKEFKDRYYAGHPEQKLRNNIKRVGQLAQYFAADDANRALYLHQNPGFAKWLAQQSTKEQTRRMMIMEAYRALPPGDEWLRRVFREKYPEIFSAQAKGEQSLKKTYGFLTDHPDMTPGFEKWVAAVWASYAQNIQHAGTPPKPITFDHSNTRQHGTNKYAGRHTGHSAEWVRIHSIS